MSLSSLLEEKKVLVLLGAGGVGKTTTSVAIAFAAAMKGKRVGLLSIDPARRLASALGISMGQNLHKVDLEGLELHGGSIHAAMIDQKEVFDEMVRRHAPSPKVRDKILNHGLYKACSEYLGGAVEYMALARLQDMVESQSYDLIVLDTPPANHVVDFLYKPNILADFFESNVTKLLLKPFVLASKMGLGRIMSFGEKAMGGLAKIAGIKSLELLAEFMILLQDVLQGFNKAGERIQATLRQDSTAFMCVTAPRPDSFKATVNITESLKAMSFEMGAIVWNREMYSLFNQQLESIRKSDIVSEQLIRDLAVFQSNLELQATLYEKMAEFADKEGLLLLKIAESLEDIHNVESMYSYAGSLDS